MVKQLISEQSQSDAQQEFQFAIFIELDWESMENFLSFLQYQGNEEPLAQLAKYCDQVDFTCLPSKCSAFRLPLTTLVSEKTAQEMSQTDISLNYPPQVCFGQLKLPEISQSRPIPSQLHSYFCHQKICLYFEPFQK